MKRRSIIWILLLSFLGAFDVQIAVAQDAREEISLQRRLQRLQERMGAPGTGLLARYRESVLRLENTVHKGEYRQFHRFVRDEIVAPWQEVNVDGILHLHSTPPAELDAVQSIMLRRNGLLVLKINNKLRRVRRLLTRVEKQHADMQRRAQELQQLGRRYGRLVTELETESPEAAASYHDWLEGSFRTRLEPLRDRDRIVGEKVERLLRWTEDPGLRRMLHRLRKVTLAIQDLRRHYDRSPRR